MKNCPDCKHDEHEPGKCPHDNCGEGEISHSHAMSTDHTRIVTQQSFKRGEVSIRDVAHIKPRKTNSE
jgi:hypothetical protein